MVSLSLIKFFELSGLGKIDETLFWEKLGLGKNGLYIADLGGSHERGSRRSLNFQIYSRDDSDVAAYQRLQKAADLLASSFTVCGLPPVPPVTDYGYKNVTILPPSEITSHGPDINGGVVYSITGQLYYGDKKFNNS